MKMRDYERCDECDNVPLRIKHEKPYVWAECPSCGKRFTYLGITADYIEE